MKTISFSIPCFNERGNIALLVEKIIMMFQHDFPQYQCVIEFIDNKSTDGTIDELRRICKEYPQNVKAILNSRNFGGVSSYYGLTQSKGDCTIIIPSDFQVPLTIIPQLIAEWEKGSKVVCAIRAGSAEKKRMMAARNLYYRIVDKFSEIPQISNFTGAGLYDKDFVAWLKTLNEAAPSLRNLVAEYGDRITYVSYREQPRKWGHSKHNFFTLFLLATRKLLTYTSLVPVLAMCCSLVCAIATVATIVVGGVVGIFFKTSIQIYILLTVLFMLASIIMFFTYLLFIYLRIIDNKTTHHPLVTESERIDLTNQEITI